MDVQAQRRTYWRCTRVEANRPWMPIFLPEALEALVKASPDERRACRDTRSSCLWIGCVRRISTRIAWGCSNGNSYPLSATARRYQFLSGASRVIRASSSICCHCASNAQMVQLNKMSAPK